MGRNLQRLFLSLTHFKFISDSRSLRLLVHFVPLGITIISILKPGENICLEFILLLLVTKETEVDPAVLGYFICVSTLLHALETFFT